MVKIYTFQADFEKFLYPLCRSRVHELNLEELPAPISVSDFNLVEKIDRLIKIFSEAIPRQNERKKLHYSNFLFRLKARKLYLIYSIDDSSATNLPSASSKWWENFAQRQQENNQPRTVSPESRLFREQGSEMSVSQMAKFLEREVIQLYIEFDSYVEVDRLARKESDQLKAAKILDDWLKSDKNSARISEEKLSEGRTNGAFTRWKPITKWYREEITKFETLLKLLTEFDWRKAKPNDIKKILEDEDLTWSVGGAEARSGKDNKIIINNLIEIIRTAEFVINKINLIEITRIRTFICFYRILPWLVARNTRIVIEMDLNTNAQTRGRLKRFFWRAGEEWQKDEKKAKEFEAIITDARLGPKYSSVQAQKKEQEFSIKENNLRLAVIAGELIQKYLVDKKKRKQSKYSQKHLKEHLQSLQNQNQTYEQLWEQVGLKSYKEQIQKQAQLEIITAYGDKTNEVKKPSYLPALDNIIGSDWRKQIRSLTDIDHIRAKKNEFLALIAKTEIIFIPQPEKPVSQEEPPVKEPPKETPPQEEPAVLSQRITEVKQTIIQTLKKFNLKAQQLSKEFWDWEQKIGQMTSLKEVEEFMKKMEQSITQTAQFQTTIAPTNNFTTPWKLVIGVGVILLLVELVYVYYLLVKRGMRRKRSSQIEK